MMPTLLRSALCALLVVVFAMPAVAEEPAEDFAGSGAWTRLSNPGGDVRRLDIAVRLYKPIEGDGPTVALVGAVHIADQSFYAAAQAFLDGQDIVLFEGVRQPGDAVAELGSDEDKWNRSERRLEFLKVLAQAYTTKKGQAPASLETLLAAGAESTNTMLRRKLGVASHDAWGHPVQTETKDGVLVAMITYGADNKPGGEGVNADIRVELGAEDEDGFSTANLYGTIAEAPGLTMQGDHILTDQPGWINSDMGWDEMKKSFGDDSKTMKMLEMATSEGNPLMDSMMEGIKGLMKTQPKMAVMMKWMMISQLGNPNGAMKMAAMVSPDFERVLIQKRNQVVIDDLNKVLKDQPKAKTIAAFYGAGHMVDMEKRLHDQLGYECITGFWLPAITLDLNLAGLSDADKKSMQMLMGK